jgi:aspartate/tyrosine/aromatic aminotransferase
MFESLPVAPPDSILGLSEEFQKDPRTDKVNLTVGVFKDDKGQTPVLASVKAAESRLLSNEKTKGYLGIDGLGSYTKLVTTLVLGESFPAERVATIQSPGGTGALRIASDLLNKFAPSKRIWLSDPTWANHKSIFETAGLNAQTHPYIAADRVSADVDAMVSFLKNNASRGDMICLHACCHNPTGIDPTAEQWKNIAAAIGDIGMIPLVDFAYQGFGDGIDQDQIGLKSVLDACDDAVVCASFSKNFGLYSERVGAVMFICRDRAAADATISQGKVVVRSNYSNPPRHGASIVAEILADAALKQQWTQEVDAMRGRIDAMRKSFVQTMQKKDSGRDFSFLNSQKGMFSYSGLNQKHAAWLKQNKAIYILGTGRINVAGMATDTMDYLCDSLTECLKAVGD